MTLTPRRISDGVTETLYLAGGGMSCPYRFGGQDYKAGIVTLPRFRAQLDWGDEGWSGGVLPQTSSFAWGPSRPSDYLAIPANYVWKDAAILVEVGEEQDTPFNVTTNFLLYSQQFNNAAWNKSEATVTADAGTAPDSTSTADKLIPSINSARHFIYQSALAAATYTVSVYAKPSGYNDIALAFSNVAGLWSVVTFNVSTGVVGASSQAGGVALPSAATIESVGSGWYRCSATFPSSVIAAGANVPMVMATGGGEPIFEGFAGNGTNGVLIWQAQVVEGPVPGPIALSTSSPATISSLRSGGSPPASWATALNGTIAGITAEDGLITFTVADLSKTLDKPIAAARFAGSGGIEGPAEAKERPKRRSWGTVFNVEARILDKANQIYEFGDPAFQATSVSDVRDMGRSALPAPTTVAWAGSIAATFTALQASSPAQGSCVIAPSIACLKWWTTPVGPLTVDLIGEGGAQSAPKIATTMLAALAPAIAWSTGDRDAADALRPDTAGIHIGSESITIAQALDQLLLGVSMAWVLDSAGNVKFRAITLTGAVELLVSQQVSRVKVFPHQKVRRLGYKRNNRVQNDGEIAAVLADYVVASGRNLLTDDTFLPGFWTLTNAVRVAGDASGTFKDSQRPFVAEAALGQGTAIVLTALDRVPVNVSQMYWQGLRVAVSTGSSGTATIALTGQFYDAAGATVGSGFNVTVARSDLPTDGSYLNSFVGGLAAPATAVAVSFVASVAANSAVGTLRFDFPQVLDTEPGADVTTQITGPTSADVNYDYTGTTIEQAVDLGFWLSSGIATVTTGTITATYTVLDGTVNGFNLASGAQAITPSSGIATFTVSTLATDAATVEIAMTRNGITRKQTVVLTKKRAAQPPPGGGGGGYSSAQTSAFVTLVTPWTTFANVLTDRIQITMPTGKTTARVFVSLQGRWLPKTVTNRGPWNLEFKVQRNTGTTGSPTWTDIGAIQNSNPDPFIDASVEGYLFSSAGTLSYSFDDTGRTAGNTYEYRVLVRVSTGTVAGNTGGINFTGEVSLSAP